MQSSEELPGTRSLLCKHERERHRDDRYLFNHGEDGGENKVTLRGEKFRTPVPAFSLEPRTRTRLPWLSF